VEFHVLGPLRVVDGDTELSLGGPRHLLLLAALLVHRGEVVPSDRLISVLWGIAPPRSAVAGLSVPAPTSVFIGATMTHP